MRILQHFATKLWNITNFVMLLQAVMKFLSRSKFSLLGKWSIPIVVNCQFHIVHFVNVVGMWDSVPVPST